MKGLDTNVLVRYLTLDDKRQAATASKEIENAAETGERMLIQPLVLCELVWVLESSYGLEKREVLAALEHIARTAQFEIAEKDLIWAAMEDYRQGRGDFSDYYLGRANEKGGARITLTFDKALKGAARFQVLTP